MEGFKGTPAPWKVNTIGQHWNNKSLTHIEVTFGEDGECVCDTVYQMADANLIASAPELLEALQICAGYLGELDHSSAIYIAMMDKANEAIDKALGQ